MELQTSRSTSISIYWYYLSIVMFVAGFFFNKIKCQWDLCKYRVSESLFSCFVYDPHNVNIFWGYHIPEAFILSFIDEYNKIGWRNFQRIMLPKMFACTITMIWRIFKTWSYGAFFPKAVLIFPEYFLDFKLNRNDKQGVIKLYNNSRKSYAPEVLSNYVEIFCGIGEFRISFISL